MKILFLDIDGVLNGHDKHEHNKYTKINPDCMWLLNKIILQTGCKLVISSAWRYMINTIDNCMNLVGFEYMLRTHGLLCENEKDFHIIGKTCCDEILRKREDQILLWLTNCNDPIEAWCVVDDLDLKIRNFVKTDPNTGLDFETTNKIIRMFDDRTRKSVL